MKLLIMLRRTGEAIRCCIVFPCLRSLLVGDYRGDIRIFDTTPSVSSGDGGIGAGDGGPGKRTRRCCRIVLACDVDA